MTKTIKELIERVDAASAKAKAEGYVAPDGTYTFTNKEGSVVSAALGVVALLLQGQKEAAQLLFLSVATAGPEAEEILSRISQQILTKQIPHFVDAEVNRYTDQLARDNSARNQTNKNLS